MNKRIFIIGSGPSLSYTPLELLAGEDTFACNKIHMLYPYTSWRPKYYYMVDFDSIAGVAWRDRVTENLKYCERLWLWEGFREGFKPPHHFADILPDGFGEHEKITYLPRCPKHHYYAADNYRRMNSWSWHLPDICTAVNSISAMMQIATLLGYAEIYLLGCDAGYTPDRTKNHFTPGYSDDPRDKSAMDNLAVLTAHRVSRRDSPIPIFNAGVNGSLDVHPRVNLKDIL